VEIQELGIEGVNGNMNTTVLKDDGRLHRLFRCASALATILAASALVAVGPVFARSLNNPAFGSGDAKSPSFEEPWDDGSTSFASPALAPAPEEPAAASQGRVFEGFTSEPSAGPWMERPESQFAQPWVNPSTSVTNPMPEMPPAGISHDGFDGRVP